MSILDIYEMLDSKNDDTVQAQGIERALETGYIDPFLLPMHPINSKNIWENCAKIIARKSDQALNPYLMPLLAWLQDLNWPGTYIIIDRLLKFKGAYLAGPYTRTCADAFEDPVENEQWLIYLSKLLENTELAEALPQDLFQEMEIRYKSFWGKISKKK